MSTKGFSKEMIFTTEDVVFIRWILLPALFGYDFRDAAKILRHHAGQQMVGVRSYYFYTYSYANISIAEKKTSSKPTEYLLLAQEHNPPRRSLQMETSRQIADVSSNSYGS